MMLKDFTIANTSGFVNETIAAGHFRRKDIPVGSASGDSDDFIMKLGRALITSEEYEKRGEAISGSPKISNRCTDRIIFMDRRSSEKTQKYVTVHLSVAMQS